MRVFKLISMVLLLGLWVAVSGCNAENKEVDGVDPNTDSHELLYTESVSYAIGDDSGRDTVIINNMMFNPEHYTVHKGDTVVWINNEQVAHNVTVDSQGKSWTSDEIQPGGSWMKVIDEGFEYFSSHDSKMKGRIILSDK